MTLARALRHPYRRQTGPPPHALVFLIDALAVHRVTRLITEDTLTAPLRELIWSRFPAHDTHGPGYILTCPYCASVYAAFVIAATHIPQVRSIRFLVYSLAIADVTAILADRGNQSATNWS